MCTLPRIPCCSRRRIRAVLAWVFSSTSPYTTRIPACSSLRAQSMFRSSSNRALSSTNTKTSLPRWAARSRASTIPERPPARYSVSLIAATSRSSPPRFGGGPLPFDPPERAVRPAFRLLLDHLHQTRGRVPVELQAGAPSHAERVGRLDASPRIERAQVLANDVLHWDEPAALRERHEARRRVRHLQVGEVDRSGTGVADHDGEREAQVGDEGEGMAGRAGQGLGRDDRKDLLREVAPQRFPLRLR